MKRISIFLFVVLLCVSCTPEPEPHVHEFSETWSYDEANHWHDAVCGDTDEIADCASHVLGEPYVISYATFEANGTIRQKCTVCEYEKDEAYSRTDEEGPGWSEFIDDPVLGRVLVKYDANGKKIMETLFHSKGIVKQETLFDPDTGKKTSEIHYLENGVSIYEVSTYVDGVLSLKKEYDEYGDLVKESSYKNVNGNAVLVYVIKYGYSSYEKFVYEDDGQTISYSDKFFIGSNIQINHVFYMNGKPRVIYDYDSDGWMYLITTISPVDGSYIEEFFDKNAIKYLENSRDANGSLISETEFENEIPVRRKRYIPPSSYIIDYYDATGTYIEKSEYVDFYNHVERREIYYNDGTLMYVSRFRADGTLSQYEEYDRGTWIKTTYYKEDGITVDHVEP